MTREVCTTAGTPHAHRRAGGSDDPWSAALAAAFRLEYGVCFRLALRVVRERWLAEEVVQEAFLAAWQHGPTRFDPRRGPLELWLITLTRHKAIDAVRHAEHVKRVRRHEEAELHSATSKELTEDLLLRSQAADGLRDRIRSLPVAPAAGPTACLLGGAVAVADRSMRRDPAGHGEDQDIGRSPSLTHPAP